VQKQVKTYNASAWYDIIVFFQDGKRSENCVDRTILRYCTNYLMDYICCRMVVKTNKNLGKAIGY
jgi:hypothetical protein